MDKNTGGAKPKTGTGTNNNNSNTRTGGSSQATSRTTTNRNRSPRREPSNGYSSSYTTQRVGPRNTRSTAGHSPSRRAPVANSVARSRNTAANSMRASTQRSRASDAASSTPSRNLDGSFDSQTSNNSSSAYSRPVLRSRVRPAGEPMSVTLDSLGETEDFGPMPLPSFSSPFPPLPEIPRPSTHFQSLLSDTFESDDSDSDPCSPDSLSETLGSAPPSQSSSATAVDHMFPSGRPGASRPVSTSRDASVARDMMQEEMDAMLERDAEIARQLQEEINRETDIEHPLFMNPPVMDAVRPLGRSRHFPSIPTRQEAGRFAARGRERRPTGLTFSRGLDGTLRLGFGPRGLRLVMGSRGAGARRSLDPDPDRDEDDTESAASGPLSPDDDNRSEEFDPDERLLGSGLDPADDFLSVMNDPSLMLLMLLLRAPDTLYQNEAGVDLEDYEGLWELAERIGEVRHRGISDDQISQIPTLKFKSQNGEAAAVADSDMVQCQICLVDFENGDCLRSIPCKHDFHKDCIDQWLKRNATCPICRQDVKPVACHA